MNTHGESRQRYIDARSCLLDAADALGVHLNAVVLVGAQAVYAHTSDTEIAVDEYTYDADFAFEPDGLADSPSIATLMSAAGFIHRGQPGQWLSPGGVEVDLMVPELLAGTGSRSADLGTHGKHVARRAKGLEAAIIDRERMLIHALEPTDRRIVEMNVAGPSALLVAKIHKIGDRSSTPDRQVDKDALDVLRLLQCVSTDELCTRLARLRQEELSRDVTDEAIAQMPLLFGSADCVGVRMAVRAVGHSEDPDVVTSSMVILINDLLGGL